MKHKHSETIKAWADGAKIQLKTGLKDIPWMDELYPTWDEDDEYRVKHKHQDIIDAYGRGEAVQFMDGDGVWLDLTTNYPTWYENTHYRIKLKIEEEVKSDIDYILENFEFGRVNEAMTFLNWHWYGIGIPSIDQLRDRARELLNDVVDAVNKKADNDPNQVANYYIATGGFYVDGSKYPDSPKLYLRLSFQVTEWDNWEKLIGMNGE